MSRWSTRFRRAASLLLGVHLLQVILLAASAVCDLPAMSTARETQVAEVTGALDAHASHALHHVAPPVGDTPQEAPHHTTHTTSCPMAMACVATAIVAPVPVLASHELRIGTDRIVHETRVLRSMREAPEPPPPRA